MDMKEEIRALLDEYNGKCFSEGASLDDLQSRIDHFLRKHGLKDIQFTLDTRDQREDISVFIVEFVDYDLLAKVTANRIQKQGLFKESIVYQYMIEPYMRTDQRIMQVIDEFTGHDFMDEYHYKEPETAIFELLRLNNLDEVKFEIETIYDSSFRGHVSAEYTVTFPEYGIMATLVIETTERNNRGEWDDYYQYSFKEKEVEEIAKKKPVEYPLSFWDAANHCLNSEGFIRGDKFAKGVYVRCKDEKLVLVDGGNLHQTMGSLEITNELRLQSYKLFSVANSETIGLR